MTAAFLEEDDIKAGTSIKALKAAYRRGSADQSKRSKIRDLSESQSSESDSSSDSSSSSSSSDTDVSI